MKSLKKRLPLFICLLLFLSMAKANNSSSQNSFEFSNITLENATIVGNGLADHPSSHNSFEFLNITLENTTFVESGTTLGINAAVLYFSDLINTGIWWAICKAPDFISAMARQHQLTDLEKQEVKSIKSDFCLQLAPLITKTEITLAGQVSSWPVDPLLWRSVFLMGAVLAAHSTSHEVQSTPQKIATNVLAYLAAEGFSRAVSSSLSTTILKNIGKINIEETSYYANLYIVLAMATGVMTGSIIYKALLHKGFSSAGARSISVTSTIIASVLSHAISLYNAGFNIWDNLGRFATDASTAAAIGALGTTVLTVAGTTTTVAAAAITAAIAGSSIGAMSGTEAGFGAAAKFGFVVGINTLALAGAAVGALHITGMAGVSNNLLLQFFGGAIVTTHLIFSNGVTRYVTYGYPLEQTVSKTTQTLWNKFLAPLDYIATLFPQLLNKHELEE